VGAYSELIAALQGSAGATSSTEAYQIAAAGGTAATAANSNTGSRQLKAFHSLIGSGDTQALLGKLFECLPSSSLTHLGFALSSADAGYMHALCGLTALRSVDIELPSWALSSAGSVLEPLSALQHLTAVQFLNGSMHREQLQHLRPRSCST
jgi:hypothetical protein